MSATHPVTIAGLSFDVPLRYEPGHVLTEGEASALNQTLCENVRNNIAPRIKKAEEALAEGQTIVHSEWQATVADYATKYEFGVRAISTPADPLEAEVNRMVRAIIKTALKSALEEKKLTGKAKDYDSQLDGWIESFKADPAKIEPVRKDAAKALKNKRAAAASLFDSITMQAQ